MTTSIIQSPIFAQYRVQINELLAKSINSMGPKSPLRDAIEYSLTNNGKRFRPMIVFMVQKALQSSYNVESIALSVEFFHTASLIADDLPCMDNDDERRSKPSLHKEYNEATAVLASFTLISMGYEKISENAKALIEQGVPSEKANEICRICLDIVTKCAGIFGATNGQFLDLFPPDNRLETIETILYQKTVTLFEISFVCGWAFSGGDLSRLKELKQVAFDFGMAFQIADDLQDLSQDQQEGDSSNIACILGKDKAAALFGAHMQSLREKLISLGLFTESFEELLKALAALSKTN